MFNSKENVEETMVLNGGIDIELSSALDNTFSRSSSSKESLNRELKKKIRKNISDWNYIDSLISTLIPEQLIELEIFLWNEAIEFAEGALQKKLAREFITAHMEPTANYHRRQMCGEPLSACRANYCLHSNPACASRKLKEQIRAITKVFDRRTEREMEHDRALEHFLKKLIIKFGLFSIIVTTENGMPISAISDLEQSATGNQSEFVRFFYKHLERYIKNEKSSGSVYFDVPLQAVSQKVFIGAQMLIITLVSMKSNNLDVAMFLAAMGVNRIYAENGKART
ncbi:hypothetical protein F9K33_00340 [bacterium]|nr:MAG: hypothetical protein F9K33_00340 [bacterium]